MSTFLTWFTLLYFIVLNGVYLALNVLSTLSLYRNNQHREVNELPQSFSMLEPPISVLVPAFN